MVPCSLPLAVNRDAVCDIGDWESPFIHFQDPPGTSHSSCMRAVTVFFEGSVSIAVDLPANRPQWILFSRMLWIALIKEARWNVIDREE